MSQDLSAPITWLHCKGTFDEYLTALPEKTYFKHVYSRHTNYSWSDVQLNPANKAEYDSEVRFVVPKIGDLITKMYLYFNVTKLNYGTMEYRVNDLKFVDPATMRYTATDSTESVDITVALDASKVPRSASTGYSGVTHDMFNESWMRSMGYVLPERVELWVGNQLVDSTTGDFMYIWDSLVHNPSNSVVLNTPDDNGGGFNIGTQHDQHIYVPIQFYFDESQGHAIPIGALQYHEMEVRVKLSPRPLLSSYLRYFEKATFATAPSTNPDRWMAKDVPLFYENPVGSGNLSRDPEGRVLKDQNLGGELKKVCLVTRYVFLDAFEREQFMRTRNSWLITETQHLSVPIKTTDKLYKEISLDKFSGPCKEIIFFYRADSRTIAGDGQHVDNVKFWNFESNRPTTGKKDLMWNASGYFVPGRTEEWAQIDDTLFETATLAINGKDLWTPPRDPLWFGFYLPFEFHSNGPTNNFNQNLFVMPFCFNPESTDPNGSINLSKVDRATLRLSFKHIPSYKEGAVMSDGRIHIYARTMNMFEVSQGHGRKVFMT